MMVAVACSSAFIATANADPLQSMIIKSLAGFASSISKGEESLPKV